MISAREINPAGIPQAGATWQNVHLAYTHGYGAVAALVNTATAEGQPVLTLKDVPIAPGSEPAMDQPRIYYGENGQGDFVVANANGELDFEGSTENLPYNGQGGIPIENIFRRALFAWNFKDVNLLLSNQITDDSRLMIFRDVESPRGEGRAVPVVRLRPVPRDHRRGAQVDPRRLHEHRPVPLLAERQRLGGDRGTAQRLRELHAQLGEGGRRRLSGHRHLLREPERADRRGLEQRIPRSVHGHQHRAGRPRGAFPVPGEPVPDPGLPVRELPRERPDRVLPAARLLADLARPHAAHQFGRVGRHATADAPVLPADQGAGWRHRAVPTRDPVRAGRPAEHGGVDVGELRPAGLRARHDVPSDPEHRGARSRCTRGSTTIHSSPRSARCSASRARRSTSATSS